MRYFLTALIFLIAINSTACVNASTNTAYTDIHNNNVPSLALEQQHEELCSNTPRGPPSQLAQFDSTEPQLRRGKGDNTSAHVFVIY